MEMYLCDTFLFTGQTRVHNGRQQQQNWISRLDCDSEIVTCSI